MVEVDFTLLVKVLSPLEMDLNDFVSLVVKPAPSKKVFIMLELLYLDKSPKVIILFFLSLKMFAISCDFSLKP
jgi:hypothetical protein